MQVLIFGEAKKSKCPVGMRRMVKTTPKANHKAPTHFSFATPLRYAGCLCAINRQPEKAKWCVKRKMSASRRRSITHLVFRLPQIIKGSLKPKKTTRPKQRVVFIISTIAKPIPLSLPRGDLGRCCLQRRWCFQVCAAQCFWHQRLVFPRTLAPLGRVFWKARHW